MKSKREKRNKGFLTTGGIRKFQLGVAFPPLSNEKLASLIVLVSKLRRQKFRDKRESL